MDRRLRFPAVLLLAALLAFVIYGAAQSLPGAGAIAEASAKGPAVPETIYFWYTQEALTDYVERAAVTFGQEHGVHVIPVLAQEGNLLESIHDATLEGRQVPDAYLLSSVSLERAYLAGLAVELPDAENYCSSVYFPQVAVNAGTYRGRKLFYPLYFETVALAYNADDLEDWARQAAIAELTAIDLEIADGITDEETAAAIADQIITEEDLDPAVIEETTEKYRQQAVPATLAQLLTIADTYDAPKEVDTIMEWDVSDVLFDYWFLGGSISLGGETGDQREDLSLANEASEECLRTFASMKDFFSMDAESISYERCLQDFTEGKVVFTPVTTEAVPRLARSAEEGEMSFTCGFAKLPDISEEDRTRTLSLTEGVAVNGYSEHRELAAEFARFLTVDDSRDLYLRSGKLPAASSARETLPEFEAFYDAYESSVSLPKFMETENFWMELEAMFTRVWNGKDAGLALKNLQEKLVRGMVGN